MIRRHPSGSGRAAPSRVMQPRMERATDRAVDVRDMRRSSAKLLRVLVMGGAVLAAACASVPKGGQDPAAGGTDDKASSQSGSAPGQKPSGGGVSGW